MSIELHLRIVGGLLLAVALTNFLLPGRYGWCEQTARLDLFARQVFWVHMLFILILLALMGTLCLGFAELLTSRAPLAKLVLAGLTMFWGLRLLVQLLVYDPALWRGKGFESTMHIVFTTLWCYFVAVFGTALWLQR